MVPNMKVLFLAAEATPFIKVGGLADVAGELPPIHRSLDVDVRVVIPFHTPLKHQDLDLEHVAEVEWPLSQGFERASLFCARKGNDQVYLVDGEPVRAVEGVYSEPYTDAYKFTFTSLAALRSMQVLDWQPDILHAHDWHTSTGVAWLASIRESDPFWNPVASLLTVHNLPYMGAGGEGALEKYQIPPCDHPELPHWARHLPLPLGLVFADWLNAVSPTYALEIQTPEFGLGLEGLLYSRRDRLSGILNGIDYQQWNPETDPMIASHFSRQSLLNRRENKVQLQAELDLDEASRIPLIGMVSRLAYQKGIDIAISALEAISDSDWQLIILGNGSPELEERTWDFGERHAKKARIVHRFDPGLARKIYAGADLMIIPSRYEPCGLTQLIAMRYGCVPVVSATGGLKDTVLDFGKYRDGTGFVFHPNDAQELEKTLRQALMVYKDQRRWRGLQLRGLAKHFDWERSARQYLDLYQQLSAERKSSQ
jgi:starch synthase